MHSGHSYFDIRCLVFFWLLLSLWIEEAFTQITLEEVQQHSRSTDCWSSIYGKVYDLTAYAPRHPRRGGGVSAWYPPWKVELVSYYTLLTFAFHSFVS